MQQRAATAAAASAAPGPLAVIAAVIGNGLEWYASMLYGVFAGVIAKLFFPTANPLTSLLLSLGTFSVGFFMRPLGGALLGMYSDRVGRKAALSLTILLMCIGTAMIALMPTYARIGIAAPLLLMLARLLQVSPPVGKWATRPPSCANTPHPEAPPSTSWVYASSSLFIALGLGVGKAGDARLRPG